MSINKYVGHGLLSKIHTYEAMGFEKTEQKLSASTGKIGWHSVCILTKKIGILDLVKLFFKCSVLKILGNPDFKQHWEELLTHKKVRIIYAPDITMADLATKKSEKAAETLKDIDAEPSEKTTIETLKTADSQDVKEVIVDQIQIGSTVISLKMGDMLDSGADLIVNAANQLLAHGSGVCGAIFGKAGPKELRAECKEILKQQGRRHIEDGEAVLTSAGKIQGVLGVVHTVGPRGEADDRKTKLANAYLSALELAIGRGKDLQKSSKVDPEAEYRSIAFPSISTGIFGYPPEEAAVIALEVICEFARDNPGQLDRIDLYFLGDVNNNPTVPHYQKVMAEIKPLFS